MDLTFFEIPGFRHFSLYFPFRQVSCGLYVDNSFCRLSILHKSGLALDKFSGGMDGVWINLLCSFRQITFRLCLDIFCVVLGLDKFLSKHRLIHGVACPITVYPTLAFV